MRDCVHPTQAGFMYVFIDSLMNLMLTESLPYVAFGLLEGCSSLCLLLACLPSQLTWGLQDTV